MSLEIVAQNSVGIFKWKTHLVEVRVDGTIGLIGILKNGDVRICPTDIRYNTNANIT
jgi:hypothetical protein